MDSVNTAAGSNTLTVATSGSSQGGNDLLLLDVTGAATSPWDAGGSASAKLENQDMAAVGLLTTVSVTPSTAYGLVVNAASIDDSTAYAMMGWDQYSLASTEEYLTAEGDYNGPTLSHSDENNPYGIYYNQNTSAATFIWNNYSGPVNYWSAVAGSYEAATPTASTPTGTFYIGASDPEGMIRAGWVATDNNTQIIMWNKDATIPFVAPGTSSDHFNVTEASAFIYGSAGYQRHAMYDTAGTTLIAQGNAHVAITDPFSGKDSWQGHKGTSTITQSSAPVGATHYLIVYGQDNAGTSNTHHESSGSTDGYYSLVDKATGGYAGYSLPSGSTTKIYPVRIGLVHQ
jgi:hypothetical protein